MRRAFPVRISRWIFCGAVACGACGSCSASPPPPVAPTPQIDLAQPARDRPAWPVGLVPCAKDAPEGTGCTVARSPSANTPTAAAGPAADTVWRVPVGPEDPARGPADALVTLVVFSDFECPFCKRATPVLEKLLAELPEDVRLVWKDLPLPMHPYAENAAELARVARERLGDAGFWKAHDLLYASQERLGEPTFRRIAEQLGLAWTPAWASIRAAKFGKAIQEDVALSDRVQVEATPTTFINGIKLVGALPYERTRAVVDAELAKAKRLTAAGTPRAGVYAAVMASAVQIRPANDTPPP